MSAQMLQVELETVRAQNARLAATNGQLQMEINCLKTDHRSTSTYGLESQLELYKVQNERDTLFEALQQLKAKYNKLHDAYLSKVRRCLALEEVFKKQKTVPGVMPKVGTTAPIIAPFGETRLERSQSSVPDMKSSPNDSRKIAELQKYLDESYDIIDDLEFELESIDYLQMENDQLRNEINELKEQLANQQSQSISNQDTFENRVSMTRTMFESTQITDSAPKRVTIKMAQENVNDLDNQRRIDDSTTAKACAEADAVAEVVQIIPPKIIKTAEIESQQLQRELLRSRLQNTPWRKKKETTTTTNTN